MSSIEHFRDPIAAVLSDPQCLVRVREYCQLAMRSHLSDAEADRFEQLLALAEDDGRLDFWFHEVDHFLDHALGLGSTNQVYAAVNENFKSQLRELLAASPASPSVLREELEDLEESLLRGPAAIQQHLKRQGYDPGPIDGFVGPKTRAALAQFQQAFPGSEHLATEFHEE